MQCTGLDMIIYVRSLYYVENTSSVKFSCKDFGSSLLAENITPSNFSSLLSPLCGTSMNSGVCCKVEIFFLLHGMLLISLFLLILSIKKGRKSWLQIITPNSVIKLTVILLVDKWNVYSNFNMKSHFHTLLWFYHNLLSYCVK